MSANIEHLRAVGRAATEGPWEAEIAETRSGTQIVTVFTGDEAIYEDRCAKLDDAEFCATARNEWDGLLDEVVRLRGQVARIEALVEEWGEYGPDSEAWRVFGEQVLSVPFATASLRAALADQSAQDDTEGAQRGAQGIEGGKA